MKRFFTMLLILSLLLSLTACGNTHAKETLPEVMVPASEPAMETVPETKEAPEGTEPEAAPYYGTWEVKDSQSADVSALSSDEVSTFVGKCITYQADAVRMDGETARVGFVTYETDAAASDEASIMEEYRANLGEWWNNVSEVTGITVDSPEAFFGHRFFVVDSDTIWIFYEGVFFLAKRV